METVLEDLLTPTEVAKILKVHRQSVIRYCQDGVIECYAFKRFSKTLYRFTNEMVKRFLQRHFKKIAEFYR